MANDVIKSIKKSQIQSALLEKIRTEKNIIGEHLKLPCKTRWGSHVSTLKSIKTNKAALQALAVHENIQVAAEVKAIILDEHFWTMVNQTVDIFMPITESIFKIEGNDYNLNKMFIVIKDMNSKIKFVLPTITILHSADKERLTADIENRTSQIIKPIHCAAYMLDPQAQGIELMEDQETEAMEFIYDAANHLNIDCLANLAKFKAKEGLWGKQFVWQAAQDVDPVLSWKGICGSTTLSKLAIRILTAPCTSAATERSFSTHGFIHDARRNRLTTERAAKINYLACNWNLMHKKDSNDDLSLTNNDDESSDFIEIPDNDSVMSISDEVEASTSTQEQRFEFINIDGHFSSEDD